MLLQGCVRLQLGYGVGARLQTGNVPRRRDRHIAPRNQHLVRCLMLLSDLWILLLLVGPRRFLICLFVCRSKMSSRDSSPGATTVVRNTTNSAKTFSASSTCETDLGLNSLYSLNLNVMNLFVVLNLIDISCVGQHQGSAITYLRHASWWRTEIIGTALTNRKIRGIQGLHTLLALTVEIT